MLWGELGVPAVWRGAHPHQNARGEYNSEKVEQSTLIAFKDEGGRTFIVDVQYRNAFAAVDVLGEIIDD